MTIGDQLSGFLRHYMDQHTGRETLMHMAESGLRQQFGRCAPEILDALIDGKTICVDLTRITTQLAAFNFNVASDCTIRTPEQQLQDVVERKGFKELKAFAESRGLQLDYRIEAAEGGAHATRIMADVTLAPFKDPKVAQCAATRVRCAHWPHRAEPVVPAAWLAARSSAAPSAAHP